MPAPATAPDAPIVHSRPPTAAHFGTPKLQIVRENWGLEKACGLQQHAAMLHALSSLGAVVVTCVVLGAFACSSETQASSSVDGGASRAGGGSGNGAGGETAGNGGANAGGVTGNAGRGAGGSNAGGAHAGGTANGGSTSGSGGTSGACKPVAIHMNPGGPPPGSDFCSGPPNCQSGEAFSVLDAAGKPLMTGLSCGMTDCKGCLAQPCPPGSCHFSSPVPAAGTDFNWDGTVYDAASGCGSGQIGSPPLACWMPSCAPPGHYVAHLCAYAMPSNSDGGFQVCELHAEVKPTCVDVPFDYPTTTQVVGVLDPRK